MGLQVLAEMELRVDGMLRLLLGHSWSLFIPKHLLHVFILLFCSLLDGISACFILWSQNFFKVSSSICGFAWHLTSLCLGVECLVWGGILGLWFGWRLLRGFLWRSAPVAWKVSSRVSIKAALICFFFVNISVVVEKILSLEHFSMLDWKSQGHDLGSRQSRTWRHTLLEASLKKWSLAYKSLIWHLPLHFAEPFDSNWTILSPSMNKAKVTRH